MNSDHARVLLNAVTRSIKAANYPIPSLTCLEIGARKPKRITARSEEPFYSVEGAKVIAFEADAAEAERLAKAYAGRSFQCIGLVLSDQVGDVEFHVTRDPKCSSLLAPNDKVLDRFPGLGVAKLDRLAALSATTLDRLLADDVISPAQFIKLDVQGGELRILDGADRALQSCLAAVLEVSFAEIYKGQPLFGDVQTYMQDRGFEFHSFVKLGGINLEAGLPNVSRHSWGDAIFLRPLEALSSADDLAGLALLAAAYGRTDVAIAIRA